MNYKKITLPICLCLSLLIGMTLNVAPAGAAESTQSKTKKASSTTKSAATKKASTSTKSAATKKASTSSKSAPAAKLTPVSWDDVATYDFDKSRKPLTTVEANLKIASKKELQAIEKNVCEILNREDATYASKLYACRWLRQIGGVACVPELAKLLSDEQLSDPARLALQGNPSPKAGAALRDAVDQLDGALKIGVISSLGYRRDRDAVAKIAPLISGEDSAIAKAAISALGSIGGQESVQALHNGKISEDRLAVAYDAILQCADSLLKEEKSEQAMDAYDDLIDGTLPSHIRIAAYRGLVHASSDAGDVLLAMLKQDDTEIQQAAAKFMLEAKDKSAVAKVAESLPEFSPITQTTVIASLATLGDVDARSAVVQAAESGVDTSVKTAAFKALGKLGDKSAVAMLAQAANQEGELGNTAFQSLSEMSDPDVDLEIRSQLKKADATMRPLYIRALVARRSDGAMEDLLALAQDEDASVRRDAVKGLTALATGDDLPALLALIEKSSNPDELKALQDSIAEVAGRMEDPVQRTDTLLSAYKTTQGPAKMSLIALLQKFGGATAFVAVQDALNDSDEAVAQSALNAAVEWPDAAPLPILMEMLKKNDLAGEKKAQVFRGVLRQIPMTGGTTSGLLGYYKIAMEAASTPEEKAQVLTGVARQVDPQSLDFIEPYLTDAQLGEPAREAYKALIERLQSSSPDRSQWKVTASNNRRGAQNAIDNDPNTRWETGETQKPGQWFQVDLGAEMAVQKIILDSANSSGDYPRGYEVYLSTTDGVWNSPAAQGKGEGPVIEIELTPLATRYIKIVQTGSVEGLFWSIHELKIEAAKNDERINQALETLKQAEAK